MQIVADNYLERLAFEMESLGMQIEQCSLVIFLEIFPSLLAANPFDLLEYSKLAPQHYIYAFCIMSTLIGKGLNTNNYSNWLRQRSRSFGPPLGLTDGDANFKRLEPSVPVARDFNNEIKMHGRIRRLYLDSCGVSQKRAIY